MDGKLLYRIAMTGDIKQLRMALVVLQGSEELHYTDKVSALYQIRTAASLLPKLLVTSFFVHNGLFSIYSGILITCHSLSLYLACVYSRMIA